MELILADMPLFSQRYADIVENPISTLKSAINTKNTKQPTPIAHHNHTALASLCRGTYVYILPTADSDTLLHRAYPYP